jgi:hypothetical protein
MSAREPHGVAGHRVLDRGDDARIGKEGKRARIHAHEGRAPKQLSPRVVYQILVPDPQVPSVEQTDELGQEIDLRPIEGGI